MMRVLKSKFFLAVEIVVVAASLVALFEIRSKKKAIEEEISALEGQLSTVKSENAELGARLEKTNFASYAELQAKRKLHYRRPEETVFVFYEDQSQSLSQTEDPQNSGEDTEVINPIRWWRYFFGPRS